MNQDRLSRHPPEGILDFNVTLNFGPQFDQLSDLIIETREMLLPTIFNSVHMGAMVLGAVLGAMLTTIIFLALRSRKVAAALVATTLASLATAPLAAQPPEPQVDLITIPYVDKNFGSKIDGAGMCVFNAFRGSLVSQYRDDFDDYAVWLASKFPGGGYPSRVTEYTRAYCSAKGIQGFDDQYLQVVGEDTLSAMQEAVEDGRSVAVTDSGDTKYYGRPVAHMTNLVHLDDRFAGIVDNNRPHFVEWITRQEFVKRHRHYDKGWCIIYLGKPQLSRPVNQPLTPSPRDGPRLSFEPLGLPLLLAQWGGKPCDSSSLPTSLPSSDATWFPQGNGVWRLVVSGVIRGEYHESDGKYWVYRAGGGLIESECPYKFPTESGPSSLPTGVFYEGFPELRRGQTLYGYGSLPGDDPAAKSLYQDRAKKDRTRARVVVNGSAELERRVREMLRRLGSDAFVYGREAIDVIRALGYGQGVTITAGSKKGVSIEVKFFGQGQEPSESQLRDALIKADPTYRPGGGASDDGGMDGLAIALSAMLLMLVVVYLKLWSDKR